MPGNWVWELRHSFWHPSLMDHTRKKISKLPEVQEVHIITGDWDILMKVKDKDVDAIGKFVIDKLRRVKGIEKTLTCMVFHTEKESTTIMLKTQTRKPWRK